MPKENIRKVTEYRIESGTTVTITREFVVDDEDPAVQSLPPAPPTRERSPLSQREREIMALVAQGFKNKEVAEKMFISERTVKYHLHNIFDKLGLSDRDELALYISGQPPPSSTPAAAALSIPGPLNDSACAVSEGATNIVSSLDSEKNVMDVSKILAELQAERERIEEAVLSAERLARRRGRGPGRPPDWMADIISNIISKRRGKRTGSRPSGSNDPGSQPPPAAPAAARIAGRLDKAV